MYWTWITFPIPESKHLYKSPPLAYIDSLFEYHGEGSLFAYLDKRGWISDISGSPDNDVEGFDVYRCQLALTEEGHRHHRDVLRALFSYLNMFRSHPLPHSYFDDVRQHRRDRFQFKVLRRSASFVTNAVRLLSSPHYPRQHLYAAKDLLLDYSPELIQRTLEFLRPDNCVMLIGSDDLDVAYNKKEKYFGIEYRRDPIDPEFLEELRNIEPFPEFKLPPKNPYMVKGLKPITGIEKAKNPVLEPTLLLRSNLGEVWHRKDDRFFLPRGEINLKMTLPHICDSAKSDVAFDLLVNILNKELKLLTSQFSLAGLGYELLAYYDSMKLDVYGFTPKLLLAYSTVLEFIRNYAPTRERFESEKTDLLKDLCNFVHEQPDSHAVAFNKYLLCSKAAYIDDCVEELKATDYDQFTQFVADVFSEAYFKVMAVGYFDEDTALRAYRLAVDLFNPQPAISIERRHPIRANRQKPGRYILQRTSMSSDNLNSAVCHTVYFGNLSVIEHN
ncbi:metalloprotease, partial [Spiromyces aspiralis]